MGGPISWLKGLFRPKDATLADPTDWLLDALRAGGKVSSGVTVSALNVLGLATVYACIDVITKTIATLPLKVYRRTENGPEEVRNHPLYELLHLAPNNDMSSADWRRAIQFHLSLWNNGYCEIVRDQAGRPAELLPVDDVLELDRLESGELVYLRTDHASVMGRDMMHLKDVTEGGLQGLNKVSMLKEVFGLSIAMERNAGSFFGNSSRPGLTIEHPSRLGDVAYERLKRSLEDNRKGAENAYRTLILEEGMKIAAAANRSENRESQFDESRRRQGEDIARIFGVPPHKVGDLTNATYSNIESQEIAYVTGTVHPIVVTWEQAMMLRLLSRRERRAGYFIEFDLRGLVRGDLLKRSQAYALGRQWGWLSRNDIRSLENMPRIEGGDDYLTPMNMHVLGEEPEDEEAEQAANAAALARMLSKRGSSNGWANGNGTETMTLNV